MIQYPIAAFIDRTENRDCGAGVFVLGDPLFLIVNLGCEIWRQLGSTLILLGNLEDPFRGRGWVMDRINHKA